MSSIDPTKCLLHRLEGSEPELLEPAGPLTDGEGMAALTASYFDLSRFAILPAPVVVPVEDEKFRQACTHAFKMERKIHSELCSYRALLQGDRATLFEQALVQHPAPRNLLLRMTAAQEDHTRLVAGIYLGSTLADRRLGAELGAAVNKAFMSMYTSSTPALINHCLEWGQVQARAREMIVGATWQHLVRRKDWLIPDGFIAHMSCLLEHEFPSMLRAVPENRDQEKELDLFQIWVSHVELLHERRTAGRATLEALITQLSKGRPLAPVREEPLIASITMTEQQALDDWSKYISIPSLQKVVIALPRKKFTGNETLEDRGARLRSEMDALGQLPLAPFITEIRVDMHKASVPEASVMLDGCLAFLTSLCNTSLWRCRSQKQVVSLVFSEPPYEVAEYLLSRAHKPIRIKNISLSQARREHSRFNSFSVAISAEM